MKMPFVKELVEIFSFDKKRKEPMTKEFFFVVIGIFLLFNLSLILISSVVLEFLSGILLLLTAYFDFSFKTVSAIEAIFFIVAIVGLPALGFLIEFRYINPFKKRRELNCFIASVFVVTPYAIIFGQLLYPSIPILVYTVICFTVVGVCFPKMFQSLKTITIFVSLEFAIILLTQSNISPVDGSYLFFWGFAFVVSLVIGLIYHQSLEENKTRFRAMKTASKIFFNSIIFLFLGIAYAIWKSLEFLGSGDTMD